MFRKVKGSLTEMYKNPRGGMCRGCPLSFFKNKGLAMKDKDEAINFLNAGTLPQIMVEL